MSDLIENNVENEKKFKKLVEVIEKLRSPNGCPWDREQTLETLKPHLLEETYEVLEAMDSGGEELCGELGDLLLQILLQSYICEEKKEFTIYDVIDKITEKMIRRHPHVFIENKNVKNVSEVLMNWEKIKKSEKEHLERKSILDGIPEGMPSLLRAEKLQKKSSHVGFDFQNLDENFEKTLEEIKEFKESIKNKNKESIEEELGDLFFSLVNVSRHLGINAEACVARANKKYEKRFRYIENNCELKDTNLEEMNKLWEKSKKIKL